jgi:ubiquinone/menaquinone biosynthesis C-methylase UbiE
MDVSRRGDPLESDAAIGKNPSPGFVRDIKSSVTRGYRQVAPGWDRWRHEFGTAGAAVTRALVAVGRPEPGTRVLDIGCGVGEPALTLAPLVAPSEVVAIDLVPEMVRLASAAADKAGYSNITFRVADAEALPFRSGVFDLITCRGAVMHFPDPTTALCEAFRVLRSGGRAVFTSLGPAEKTPAYLATISIILSNVPRHPPQPTGLDVYRFGLPGALTSLFAAAGFREIQEEIFMAPCLWPGSAKQFWHALPEHAWGVVELMKSLTPEIRQRIATESIAALERYESGGVLHLTAPIAIASGTR